MPKPDLSTVPAFYRKYVELVSEESASEALSKSTEKVYSFLWSIPDEKWDFRYTEGKWSIREMVQHIIDAERIFAYRALSIARGERQNLPGFDENAYAEVSNASGRSKEDLLEEFGAVRKSNEFLFRSFDQAQLNATGIANNNPISVNTVAYVTVGHALHHLNVLKERYL